MRCAVLGDPIAHSLSPALHRAGYAAVGLDWTYESHRVAAGELAGFVRGLDATWRGLSLTMPLKREAADLASAVSPVAGAAGAVNTLLLVDGALHGDNTDVPGAVAALRARYDGPVTRATVLGGGATAASTALALVELGARSVTLLVRSPSRAAETLAAIDRHPNRPAVTVGSLADDPVVGDVVVSTVPAEAQSADLLERCALVPVVFDVLYEPWPTSLAQSASDRVLVTGLDLLLHQAALQFEIFTGLAAPLDAMRAALPTR
ncbi:MAG TPA: shikimate dehydrogenase [Nocardioides sp.]|nr:shikimate dehydrogenase [Nocardioides sp.]